jgi:dihydropteroate synthase
LIAEGADILDIGGESTRPRSEPVAADEELRRVVPVVRALRGAGVQISVDTAKLTVAEAAVDAGATFVNDVTAFRQEPELAGFVADRGCDCCLMHMLGEPRTMQDDPRYDDVVDDVRAFLEERVEFAVREGVREERIMVDPGIGFGKTLEHNLELLRRLDRIVTIGLPVVIGTSRKSFLGRLTGRDDPHDRVAATVATTVLALERGASVFRVHEDDEDYEDDDERAAPQTEVTIEVTGLSLYTHHGVSAAEREVGQRLVLDLRLEVGECDATVTDLVEDTVDYAAVCERVALVAQQRSYKTLERLCSALADRLLADFAAEEVWVKATKPEPPIPLAVESVSVEVWRQSGE